MNAEDKFLIFNKLKSMIYFNKPRIYNFSKYNNNNDLNKNHYLLSFKTNGAHFLLFLTTIRGKKYSLFIHYDNPNDLQIYNVKLRFDNDLYNDTIIEGELLLNDKMNWIFMLNNISYLKGEKINNYFLGQKITILSDILRKQYKFDDYLNHCHLQLRSYFLFNHLEMLSNTHNNEILMFPERSNRPILAFNIKNLHQNEKIITNLSLNPSNEKYKKFFVLKTDVPDVFEIYDDEWQNNDKKLKEKLFHGIVCLSTMGQSYYMKKLFDEIKNNQKGIWINFVYNKHLKGWEPIISN